MILSAILTVPFALAGLLVFHWFAFPFFLGGILWILYAAFLELGQGTIGKQVMGLKVVAVNGEAATLDKTLIRNVSKIYWLLWLLDVIVGMATPGDPHQKYMDRIAGTTVVSVSKSFITLPTSSTSSSSSTSAAT